MSYFSRTSLANRALDLTGQDTILDLDTSTTATGKLVQRNFEPVFLRCLRKADWNFAIKRVSLAQVSPDPVNQYAFTYALPADCFKILLVFPRFSAYKVEQKYILSDESELILKYVSDEAIQDPEKVDPCFAEYFAHELAVAISYRITDSSVLRTELRTEAERLFKESAALFSQEGVDDEMPDSPWISTRGFIPADGTIRIEGLE